MPNTPMLPARRAVECSFAGAASVVRDSEFEILIGSFLTVMSAGVIRRARCLLICRLVALGFAAWA
jgi:hypothetical protein